MGAPMHKIGAMFGKLDWRPALSGFFMASIQIRSDASIICKQNIIIGETAKG